MVTSGDVARLAGTSRAVVSYVVNGGPRGVAEPTRRRVLDAMAQLGYVPNAHARALRAASSSVVGVVVSDISNAYCAQMVLALEDAAAERRMTLLIGNTRDESPREAQHYAAFTSQRAAGIVFVGGTGPLSGLQPAVEGDPYPPTVRLDRPASAAGEAAVVVDNFGGAWSVTSHLLSHGYSSCALLSGPYRHYGVADRARGWKRALLEHGLDPAEQVVYSSGFDRYDAFAATLRVLQEHHPRTLFAHSDEQALGALSAAAHLGLKVPRDLAIVSFDGIREAGLATPTLTTVEQPMTAIADLALAIILEASSGERATPTTVLPVRLSVGDSCGPHRADGSAADGSAAV